ncbi:hypothetical protein [Ferribacterium limneticum]|uniref:hypothetical protein n=1 Tax=Ferribacterium limneticum TaxID=76259 RepID=UPI001CF86EB8|nr:hypothetical protein [Ferribacterium limneticum]UCV26794.1 hypothetical protein KI617_10775 [Ferribacterium limneticum]UCV30711.1 hypothetical protein KI608_10775 [Ferribacterium limneticum]
MAAFIDDAGQTQQVTLDVSMYRVAADNNLSFEQYVNRQFPASANGNTFDQLLASEGIFVRGDRSIGLRSASMDEVLNGRPRMEAGVIVKDAVPTSRILFPAAILAAVEDKLVADLEMNPNAFDRLVALDETISNDRWERPILNFSKPEAARSQAISQLSLPTSMLTITASQISRAIPTRSIGMEVSDQALRGTSLDLVTLALARQRATERNERANEYILSLLNGDNDIGMGALSAIANKVKKANTFDTSIATAGVLTQKAWMAFLINNATRRTITHVITDLAGALAIEQRTGKPIITNDNANSPRVNTEMVVMNPLWPQNVQIFITTDPLWPANTIVGLDARYGIHRVNSVWAAYEAVEQFVLKRSTAMRFDSGEVVERLFDDAFDVLELKL